MANCCLPSTGPTSAVNLPDKIYTDVYWEPDSGKLLSAVNAPNKPIQTNYAMSAVDGPDICH